MSRILVAMMVLALVLLAGGTAYALPAWAINNNNSCSNNCHGSSSSTGSDRDGALEVTGQGILNLDDANLPGATDRGDLQAFQGRPGDTVELTMNVLDGSDSFAVQIKRFEASAVLNDAGNTLAPWITPDPAWDSHGNAPNTYYTTDVMEWAGVTDPYTFSLQLSPDTPLDVYDLEFAVAGRDDTSGLKFYGDEHFYLQVIPEASSLWLAGLALSGLAVARRRRLHRET